MAPGADASVAFLMAARHGPTRRRGSQGPTRAANALCVAASCRTHRTAPPPLADVGPRHPLRRLADHAPNAAHRRGARRPTPSSGQQKWPTPPAPQRLGGRFAAANPAPRSAHASLVGGTRHPVHATSRAAACERERSRNARSRPTRATIHEVLAVCDWHEFAACAAWEHLRALRALFLQAGTMHAERAHSAGGSREPAPIPRGHRGPTVPRLWREGALRGGHATSRPAAPVSLRREGHEVKRNNEYTVYTPPWPRTTSSSRSSTISMTMR